MVGEVGMPRGDAPASPPIQFVHCRCGRSFSAGTEDAARWRFFKHLQVTTGSHFEVHP